MNLLSSLYLLLFFFPCLEILLSVLTCYLTKRLSSQGFSHALFLSKAVCVFTSLFFFPYASLLPPFYNCRCRASNLQVATEQLAKFFYFFFFSHETWIIEIWVGLKQEKKIFGKINCGFGQHKLWFCFLFFF